MQHWAAGWCGWEVYGKVLPALHLGLLPEAPTCCKGLVTAVLE